MMLELESVDCWWAYLIIRIKNDNAIRDHDILALIFCKLVKIQPLNKFNFLKSCPAPVIAWKQNILLRENWVESHI